MFSEFKADVKNRNSSQQQVTIRNTKFNVPSDESQDNITLNIQDVPYGDKAESDIMDSGTGCQARLDAFEPSTIRMESQEY